MALTDDQTPSGEGDQETSGAPRVFEEGPGFCLGFRSAEGDEKQTPCCFHLPSSSLLLSFIPEGENFRAGVCITQGTDFKRGI